MVIIVIIISSIDVYKNETVSQFSMEMVNFVASACSKELKMFTAETPLLLEKIFSEIIKTLFTRGISHCFPVSYHIIYQCHITFIFGRCHQN